MKIGVVLFCALAFGSYSAFADIDPASVDVFNNPAVVALCDSINQIHGGTCNVLEPQEIIWTCLGAIVPVTEPTIKATACFFNLNVNCGKEGSTIISGRRQAYMLVSPNGSGGITISQRTEPLILIDKVEPVGLY